MLDFPVIPGGGEGGVSKSTNRKLPADVVAAARQLTEEEAAIIPSLPLELQESEITFLVAQDQETRNFWVRQPDLQRKQAAARRTHARRAESARGEGRGASLKGDM